MNRKMLWPTTSDEVSYGKSPAYCWDFHVKVHQRCIHLYIFKNT